ncbi:CBS domain-containing protein [Sphingobacteriales bacterium UPWRP_1]|nr:hypothetical protein B6N25_00605 [Sphingobacteriales bacterium TSM_CSS]PSJ71982.1 CBS domain-containing protein [Sphingobacteriales bacterium UPWRP_1]
MIARNLIKNNIPPLKTTDTCGKALMWMNTFHLQHLPVVNGTHYEGMVSENQLLDSNNPGITLKDYPFEDNCAFVLQGAHIYEVLKVMNEQHLTAIAVLDEERAYLGLITLENLLEYFGQMNAAQEPGGIILLEMPAYNYSLTQIAQIIETNNARVLSMYVTTHPDTEMLEVTIKVNITDLNAIIATFERYNYEVTASFQENDYVEDIKERLDELMNYLNI